MYAIKTCKVFCEETSQNIQVTKPTIGRKFIKVFIHKEYHPCVWKFIHFKSRIVFETLLHHESNESHTHLQNSNFQNKITFAEE